MILAGEVGATAGNFVASRITSGAIVVRILLAIEESIFSDAAIQALLRQSRPDDTEVRVLSVVAPSLLTAPTQKAAEYAPELTDELRHSSNLVKPTAKKLQAAGFDVEASMRMARSGNHPRIGGRVSSRPDSSGFAREERYRRFLLGSIVESVARHTHCSVEIVRIPAAG